MALMDFIKKQFIDVIEWQETGDEVLAWRFPMRDNEIQNGGVLTVRDSQAAVFVNEGIAADAFGPGRHTLTTNTLPLLTNLRNWDKLFASPFKSDVYFFSTRQRLDQKWGTAQPVTLRDKEFGAVRVRAFGNYSFQIADPKQIAALGIADPVKHLEEGIFLEAVESKRQAKYIKLWEEVKALK